MTPETCTAYHESGHAVTAFIFRRPIYRIRIVGDSGFVSCSELAPAARDMFPYQTWRELAKQEIAINLAGPVAERLFAGRSDPRSWRKDLEMAGYWKNALGVSIATPLPVTAMQRMLSEVRTWAAVREIAQRLAGTQRMSGDAVSEICLFRGVPRISLSASLASACARASNLPEVSILPAVSGASYSVSRGRL